jgi:4,5-dihydroxyphthalate decarboxylase
MLGNISYTFNIPPIVAGVYYIQRIAGSIDQCKSRYLEANVKITRRTALRAILAAPVGIAGLSYAEEPSSAEREVEPSKGSGLTLHIAGYQYDRVAALADGRVKVDGCNLSFTKDTIGNLNTHIFSGPGTRDVTEVGLHPYILAYANDDFRDYTLLPIFPLRVFRHKSIFIRTDRGIARPEDLRGKKVATPGYSSTSLTWIRGILEEEYGIKPTDIEWFVSSADSSAKDTGGPSKFENILPKNLKVEQGPAGKDESDMLADGDVDALFHAMEPKCYVAGHPKVARLFQDFRTAEHSYFQKTGIFPIMHAVAIRNKLVDTHPWLPSALFKAYAQSKAIAIRELTTMGWAYNSLPWLAKEVEETRSLMGKNFWPYGIKPNRKTIDALCRYSHQQGLASRRLNIDELFHASSMDLTENEEA